MKNVMKKTSLIKSVLVASTAFSVVMATQSAEAYTRTRKQPSIEVHLDVLDSLRGSSTPFAQATIAPAPAAPVHSAKPTAIPFGKASAKMPVKSAPQPQPAAAAKTVAQFQPLGEPTTKIVPAPSAVTAPKAAVPVPTPAAPLAEVKVQQSFAQYEPASVMNEPVAPIITPPATIAKTEAPKKTEKQPKKPIAPKQEKVKEPVVAKTEPVLQAQPMLDELIKDKKEAPAPIAKVEAKAEPKLDEVIKDEASIAVKPKAKPMEVPEVKLDELAKELPAKKEKPKPSKVDPTKLSALSELPALEEMPAPPKAPKDTKLTSIPELPALEELPAPKASDEKLAKLPELPELEKQPSALKEMAPPPLPELAELEKKEAAPIIAEPSSALEELPPLAELPKAEKLPELKMPPLPAGEAKKEVAAKEKAKEEMKAAEETAAIVAEVNPLPSETPPPPPLVATEAPKAPVPPLPSPEKQAEKSEKEAIKEDDGMFSGLKSQVSGLLGAENTTAKEAKAPEKAKLPALPAPPSLTVTKDTKTSALPPLPKEEVDEVPVASVANRTLPPLDAIKTAQPVEKHVKAETPAEKTAPANTEDKKPEEAKLAELSLPEEVKAPAPDAEVKKESKKPEIPAKAFEEKPREEKPAEVKPSVPENIPAPEMGFDEFGRKQLRVVFSKSETEIPTSMQQPLDEFVQYMKENSGVKLQVISYAGTKVDQASIARRISLARALAVRAYFIDKGINTMRIDVKAMGNKSGPNEPQERVDIHSE